MIKADVKALIKFFDRLYINSTADDCSNPHEKYRVVCERGY